MKPLHSTVFATVLLLMVAWAKTAGAAATPPQVHARMAPTASSPPAGCQTELRSIHFSGTFSLPIAKGASPRHAPAQKPLRFVIGSVEHGMATAQIWSGNECYATCSLFEQGEFEKGENIVPISLDLQCRRVTPDATSMHVAVLWAHGKAAETVVRFGSWAEGYEQASMKVAVDRYSSPTPMVQVAQANR